MATITVDLKALVGTFVTDIQRASKEAQKAAKEIKDSLVEAGEGGKEGILEAIKSLTGLSPSQLGLGAIAAGLGEVTKQAIETGDKLNKMAQKVGIGVESLQGLMYAAQLADVGLDALGGGLAKFDKAISAAAGGSKEQQAAFLAIGISIKELQSLKPEEILGKVADKFAGFTDDANKTALAMALFGKSGAELIPFLNTGSAEIKKMSDEAKQLGLDFAAIAKPSEEFNDNLTRLKSAAVGLGVDIAKELLPVLIETEEKVLEFIKSARENGTIQAFAGAVAVLAENLDKVAIVIGSRLAFSAVASSVTLLAGAFTEAAGAATLFAGSMQLANGSLLSMKSGLAVVTAAVAGWEFGKYLEENFLEAKLAGIALVDGILSLWEVLKGNTEKAWAAIVTVIQTSLGIIDGGIGASLESIAKVAEISGAGDTAKSLHELAAGYLDAANGVKSYSDRAAEIDAKTNAAIAAIHDSTQAMADSAVAAFKASGAHKAAGDAAHDAGDKAKQATPNFTALAKAMGDDAVKAASKLAEMLNKDGEILAQIQSRLNPAQKLYSDYAKGIAEANTTYQKEIELAEKSGASQATLAQIKQNLITKTIALQGALSAETREFLKQHDIVKNYLDKIADDAALVGLSDREKEITKAVQDLTREWQKNTPEVTAWLKAMGIVDPTSEAAKQKIAEVTGALYDNKQAAEANKQAIQEWQGIWKTAGDGVASTFASILVNGGSLFSGLKDLAKQTVQAIIEYFAKLAVINPILNSIFAPNGVAQNGFQILLQLFGGAGGGLSGGNGLLGNLFGNSWAGNLLGSTAGYGSGLMGLLFGGSGSVNMLTYAGIGSDVGALGTAGLGLDAGVSGGSAGLFGSYGNVGGGLGTLGSTLGGALAGWQLGSQLGGTAGGIAGAAALGYAAYAIPVVGWIAGAATLINSLTGGGLFGTSWKPTGNSSSNLTIGSGGATVEDLVQESKKKALFGGRSWRDVSVAAPQDQIDAANQIFAGILKSVQSGATALGVQAGDLITGSFKQTFDSSGKVTANISTILGQTYSETVQQFAERVTAENLLALLPAAQNASQIAQQWRSSADTLLAGTQLLIAAQVDVNKGIGLLGDNSSLADITKEVQKLAVDGESLIQTYARLQTEQQSLQQILDNLGITSGKTGADFLEFADNLTKAAGGLSNLQTLWNDYYSNYYTDAEKAANTLKSLQSTVTKAFASIGQDPTESMADFRKNFEAAFPTLTADEVANWLVASHALAQLNAYLQQTGAAATQDAAAIAAATQKYSDFVRQFDPQASSVTTFESSLVKLHDTMLSNIQQANDLAKAAGMAGVSQQDFANIIQASAQAGVDALKAFEDQTQQLASKLYGTNVDQLTKQLTDLQTADHARLAAMDGYTAELLRPYFAQQEAAIQKQIDDANAQAQALQRLTDATSLLSNLGQIGSITGQSLDELAKQFSIPLDNFAKDLGISPNDLSKQFQQAELQASAAIQANDYLRQILDTLQGKVPQTLVADGSVVGGKSAPVTASSATQEQLGQKLDRVHDMLQKIANNTSPLGEIAQTNRDTVSAIRDGITRSRAQGYAGPRNTRSAVFG